MQSQIPKRDKDPIWKQRYSSIAAIISNGGDIKQICNTCSGAFKVDLELLKLAYGDQFDIRGKRLDCPAYDCKGTTTLLVHNGVYRRL